MNPSKLTILEDGMILLNGKEIPYVKRFDVSSEGGKSLVDVKLTFCVTELDIRYKPMRTEGEENEGGEKR